MDESKVTMKGRLGPGMMIAVDLPGGQVSAHFSFFCTRYLYKVNDAGSS
jgi:hypothetical protein